MGLIKSLFWEIYEIIFDEMFAIVLGISNLAALVHYQFLSRIVSKINK